MKWYRSRWAVLGMLAVGIAFTLLAHPDWTKANAALVTAVIAAVLVFAMPALHQPTIERLQKLQALLPRHRISGALIIGVLTFVFILSINSLNHLPFQLLWHDEHQFMLQTRLLAHGRLWMPPHELGDFFDTFYVLMTPKYAPQSFPGAALMFVPTVWLSLPTWMMPLLITALAVALMWWVIGELADPAVATIAVLALLGCFRFRQAATMYLAQGPALLLGLIAVVAWLRYRRSGNAAWVFVIGAALGWGLITRPLDAVCYAAAVGTAVIVYWLGRRWTHVVRATLLGLIGAAPFLGLQLIFNHGVTGSWTKTPFTYYNERDQPALVFGASGDLSRQPMTKVPQKRQFYKEFALPFVIMANEPGQFFHHARERINQVAGTVTPSLWAIPLAFVGIVGLRSWRQVVLASLLPLYAVAYSFYPIYMATYIIYAVPAVMLLFGLAPPTMALLAPPAMARRIEVAVAIAIVVFGIIDIYTHIPPPNGKYAFDSEASRIKSELVNIKQPAIVLFLVNTNAYLHEEPVYNDDVCWPDDAPIIKAHALGRENSKLFAYYAGRQPGRTVYLYNRENNKVTLLGNVADLARQFPISGPSTMLSN